MNIDGVVEGLVNSAEDDCIGLWMICCDIEDELADDELERTLELTLVVVRELLKRGLLAGYSPVQGARFDAWCHQDPDIVTDFIRREWERRGGPPEWGDAPWFARLRFCRTPDCC